MSQNNYAQDLGIFDACGLAMIVEIKNSKVESLSDSEFRLFFKPADSNYFSLRVRPATTTIYGPEMRVFAVPPAPEQWLVCAQRALAQNQSPHLLLKVAIFYENLREVKYLPFGVVTYRFLNSNSLPQEIVPKRQKVDTQHLQLQKVTLLVSCFIYFQAIAMTQPLTNCLK